MVVKNFIMDNVVVVGVGNIYVNEVLFMFGIDLCCKVGRVSVKCYEVFMEVIK